MKYLIINPNSKVIVIPMSSGLVNHIDSLLLAEKTWDSKTSEYKNKLLRDQTVEIELVDDSFFTPAEPIIEELQRDVTNLRSDWLKQYNRAENLAVELKEANEKLTKAVGELTKATPAATSV